MKIKITYLPSELDKKIMVDELIESLFIHTINKDTGYKDGYLHSVLTIPKPLKSVVNTEVI